MYASNTYIPHDIKDLYPFRDDFDILARKLHGTKHGERYVKSGEE